VNPESDALHARSQSFIRSALAGLRASESLDQLALDIARYQAANVPAIERLARARGVDLEHAQSSLAIPAVPTDVFRLTRVAAHPPAEDRVVFRTSGTSQGAAARGEHALRTTATYELGALGFGQQMLWPDRKAMRVAVLAPRATNLQDSSLSFMLDHFARALGAATSWHVDDGIDVAGFADACADARRENEPLLVLATSFALVHVLDERGNRDLGLPDGSRVMQTGGFKGRSREIEAHTLRDELAQVFAVDPSHVVAEYGMTELSSQLYEATIAARARGEHARHGIYVAPPWVRVDAVDPVMLSPLPHGEVGLARILDLANVDSAVVVQTADRVRVTADGVELLGRAPGAVPRGCSLAIEEMLAR
jgi:hypothetical protein